MFSASSGVGMSPDTDTNSGCGHLSGKSDKMARKQLVEIKNGRLAMLAVSGIVHHTLITGKGPLG